MKNTKRFASVFIMISILTILLIVLEIGCTAKISTDESTPPNTPVVISPPTNQINKVTSSNEMNINYSLYELKANDVRFRLGSIQHPRYSLEYPQIFKLIDLNQLREVPLNSKYTRVSFVRNQPEFPESKLNISVQYPEYMNAGNAQGLLNIYISALSKYQDVTFLQDSVSISGINAEILKYVLYDKTSVMHTSFDESEYFALFDYKGFIWQIEMDWFFNNFEQPETGPYFQHVLETFKILE
jgi:hypothetical protein